MRFLAFIIATVATASIGWLWGLPTSGDHVRNALNVVAGASATILGFLVSSGALLYAVINTRLVRNLQRTKHFGKLLDSLFFDGLCFLVALLVGLISLFLPEKPIAPEHCKITWLLAGTYVVIFTNVVAYTLLVPLGRNLWILLSNIKPDNPDTME